MNAVIYTDGENLSYSKSNQREFFRRYPGEGSTSDIGSPAEPIDVLGLDHMKAFRENDWWYVKNLSVGGGYHKVTDKNITFLYDESAGEYYVPRHLKEYKKFLGDVDEILWDWSKVPISSDNGLEYARELLDIFDVTAELVYNSDFMYNEKMKALLKAVDEWWELVLAGENTEIDISDIVSEIRSLTEKSIDRTDQFLTQGYVSE